VQERTLLIIRIFIASSAPLLSLWNVTIIQILKYDLNFIHNLWRAKCQQHQLKTTKSAMVMDTICSILKTTYFIHWPNPATQRDKYTCYGDIVNNNYDNNNNNNNKVHPITDHQGPRR
jgi:hypothetical protein